MSMSQRLDELKKKGEQAKLGGGPEKIKSQHSRGKMTARERIDGLVDPGSFVEIDRFVVHQTTDFGMAEKRILGDGVVTGHGRIDGRLVYLFSHDFTTFGGSLGEMFARKVTKIMDMADKTSYMFITGPDVIKAVLNQTVSFEELGGARVHNTTSGVAHFFARDEKECLQQMRKLLSYIPSNNTEDPPEAPARPPAGKKEELNTILPDDYNKPYDMRDIITRIVDGGELLEVQPLWAANIITTFARINGHSIGIVANQPKFNAGSIDINSSVKAARFVRFCDAFNIPILTLVDVPGFLPGIEQEHEGIIRHGSKLLYAYCEATVPKLTIIIRKAYGGAYDVLGSK